MKNFGKNNQFYINIHRNQKTFLKISSPQCANKSFCLYMCYHILHIVWKWLAGKRGGGEMFSSPKIQGLSKKIPFLPNKKLMTVMKVSKGAKIRNRYNQVPHLTQDTDGKVTNSQQTDTTNESQEISPFPAGEHKAHINRCAQRHSKHKTE